MCFIAGFVPVRYLGKDWDTACWMFSLCFIGNCAGVYYLIGAGIDLYMARSFDNQVSPPRQVVTVNVPDLNPKFGLTLRPVQIDVERAFARVLMEFPNDMTEKTWIKRGRWQQLGGGGPEQFRNILHKWEAAGIVSKRNPNVINSPYFVSRKAGLAQIAGGRSPIYYPPTAPK
jgi:hypothetical protein